MKDPAYWGIHVESAAGKHVFLTQGAVAIGWHQFGDISSIANDKDSLKAGLVAVRRMGLDRSMYLLY